MSSKNLLKKIIFVLCLSLSSNILFSQNKLIIDEVIAVVGNTPVLRSELDLLLSQLDPDVEITDQIKCDVFKELIIDKMLIHQAEIDSLPITDEEVNDKMDNNLRFFERQMNNRASLEKYLGMSIAEYKKQLFSKVKSQMLLEKMEQKIQSEIKITPNEVKTYYSKLPKDSIPFISSEVEVAQIVIKPTYSAEAKEIALEQMESLRKRLLKGESFARLATLYSEDPGSKKSGGLLPEFGRNDMVPEFERTAFTLKKDSLSEIFETRYGYHIVKLIDKRGERVNVRHILIRPKLIEDDLDKAKFKLDSILVLLRKDSLNLCKAVKIYSEDDETKPNCGYFTDPNIGTQKIPYDYLDKDMAAVIGKMKAGTYSEPVIGYAQDGSQFYRIYYLKSETKPHVANLEQDWQRIQALALEEKRKKELENWSTINRKNIYIYISKTYIQCPFFIDWNSIK